MEPGIYNDISNADYHKGPGLSSSDLKMLARSPLHYITAKQEPPKETPAMRLGTAVHCAVLEPERFSADYAQAPDVDRRTKAGREVWAELEAAGKIVLAAEEYDAVLGMAQAVREHPLAGKLFTGGKAEQSAYWTRHIYYADREADILCKCRPDYLKELHGKQVIVDLKTTKDAGIDAFQRRAFWDLGYHIQAVHYMEGIEAVTGARPQGFIFVVVESSLPYAVNVFQAAPDFLRAGRETNEGLYQVYAACRDNNNWRGYPAIINELHLPKGSN